MTDSLRNVARGQDVYLLEMDDGETWTIPGTNSSIRFLADDKTAPFAVVHSRGMPDAPVPPHFHRFAIDTWLVLQGKLNVWAGTTGRVLCAGDFAYVPPGVTHSYQVLEPHTEFLGLIHPSEWINFFKAIGEEFHGPGPFPSADTREFPKDKFIKAIKDGHDVIPQFGHKFDDASHAWTDSTVPEKPEPYFLKAHHSPRYALGGQSCAPLTYSTTSDGKFSINYLEAHQSLEHPSELSTLKFSKTCTLLFAQTGSWDLDVEGKKSVISTGGSAYVPPNAAFSLTPKSRFARAIVFADGPGIEVLFEAAGKLITGVLGSEQVDLTEERRSKLVEVAGQHGVELGGVTKV